MDIKRVIKSRNLEVREVAKKMGITPTGLSQHINGNPSVEVLKRIADAIGCRVVDFFMDELEEQEQRKPTYVCPHCGKELNIKIE